MRIEIEVHEALTEPGTPVRLRIVREIREIVGGGEETIELTREHDLGTELLGTESAGVHQDRHGNRIRLAKRIG